MAWKHWLVLAAALAPLSAQADLKGVNIENRNTTPVVKPQDWTYKFQGVWSFDDASGSSRLNTPGTALDSNLDLDLLNTVTRDTTRFIEGTASATTEDGISNRLRCLNATCAAQLQPAAGESLTWGVWFYPDVIAGDLLQKHVDFGPTTGTQMAMQADAEMRCTIADGTNVVNMDKGTIVADTWTHSVCRFDNPGDTARFYQDGAFVSPGSAYTGDVGLPPAGAFTWFSDNGGIAASLDEAWWIHDVLTDAEICRICSCGINGVTGPCDCSGDDPTTYLDTGRNSQTCASSVCSSTGEACTTNGDCGTCGGCTLPDCDASAP